MNNEIILSFIVAMIVSSLLVPIVKRIGNELNIIAKINQRTIHHGKIVRIWGYAVYISFIVCAFFFLKTDQQINSILLSGFLIFFVGLYDDIHDLKPKAKLGVEFIAASVVIFYGKIGLQGIIIPNFPRVCRKYHFDNYYIWLDYWDYKCIKFNRWIRWLMCGYFNYCISDYFFK